ncbi:ABC-2 type transport system permease protein [Saccharothrix ecbatanensis]|uniref:Transport permease protein n=1 Tax=Saccharothrix ecbatanensis TaxID=1105145 RepID=A0A7W9M5M5_9PSEU|nr:ABC transporter permease [Saccharothrix ecbatanensis]MBB5808377.1 ABC-2 type transport system permease protein [Saccharothrix ecbatanensis]
MNTKAQAIRLGVDRGVREFRHSMGSSDQFYNVFTGLAALTVLWFQRDSSVDGSDISLAALTLPSLLGMGMVFGALVGPAGQLSTNREDGTLLRAKAVPNGMVGYLVGRTVQTSLDSLTGLLIVLVPGLFLVNVLSDAGVGGVLRLFAVLALGMVSMLPWGAVAGSITKSPGGAMGITMLPMMGLVAISGIFYPITAMPGWLQGVAQVFPVYWAAHGARASLLPDAAAVAEIGGTWRIMEMIGVLGVWAVVGFLLAPTILRRMARRESGSDMEQRRQAAMQRVR